MAKVMKKVDAVVIGFGWTGAIMSKELIEAGLSVVALERGPAHDTYPLGSYPQSIDELTYNTRHKIFQNLSKSTVTFRHAKDQTAVPQTRGIFARDRHRRRGAALVGRPFSRRSHGIAHAQPL